MNDKLVQLQVAVQDLLCELRIDETALKFMSRGYSPDYPGVLGKREHSSFPKVQLSAIVAQKLINAGVLSEEE